MTLAELLGTIQTADLPALALVFDTAICEELLAVQDPTARHRVQPVALPAGRWFCCADVLTELHGIFRPIAARLDPELAGAVQVLPMADVIAMLPEPDPLPFT
ncbi:hypothetical protein EBT31_15425 [bacterium]|nr:hypothetical protein [bacterium]